MASEIKEPMQPLCHFIEIMRSPFAFCNKPNQECVKHPARIGQNLCQCMAEDYGEILKMKENTKITPMLVYATTSFLFPMLDRAYIVIAFSM